MTIGIDASRANKINKTGVEWYSYHLIQEFKKIPLLSKEGVAKQRAAAIRQGAESADCCDPGSNNRCPGPGWLPKSSANPPTPPLGKVGIDDVRFVLYANEKLSGGLEKCPKNFQEKILSWSPKYLWTQIRLWWELIINPPDVLFVPAHTIPFLPISKKIKVYVTVHDVGFKRSPKLYKPIQYYYHDLIMRRIRQRADRIITISEFSKQEIIDLYQVPAEKITVIPLGYDQEKYNEKAVADESVLAKYKIAKPFVLYVGRLEKKKNIGNIVKAFAFAKDGLLPLPEGEIEMGWEDLKLVLAGNAGNEYETIKNIITENKLANEIILPGYISEADLPTVFKMATAFLFPTLYEGFGLPILQAMAVGTPVVTSDLEPHKSVAGGAGVLVDPNNPEVMAKQINKIIKDQEFAGELRELGLKRASEFSWAKTATATLALIAGK